MGYFNTTIDVRWNEHDLQVKVEYSPFRAAVTSGPPERCCPAEGGMESILAVSLVRMVRREAIPGVVVRTQRARRLPAKLEEALMDDEQFHNEVEEAFLEEGD